MERLKQTVETMISVIIPLFNKAETIRNTIESVLRQTYSDFEIVIVDDGSTDRSIDIVKSISDLRIRIYSQSNAGVSAARNIGIENSRGEFVAFLDADDEWKTDYLKSQIRLTEKYPQCDVFASRYETCTNDGQISPAVINKLLFQGNDGIVDNYFQVASCSEPPLFTSAVMVRRSAILEVGGFPHGIKSGEDLLTWARLAARFKIAYSTTPMVSFTIEGYNVTSKPKRSNDDDDFVGRELVVLRDNYHPQYINQYISHWHKMRSSVFMRQTQREKSINEAFKGLKYNPLNYKLYIYIAINLLPKKLQPFRK